MMVGRKSAIGSRQLRIALVVALLAVSASAAQLTGTVINRTTGKPSGGDDVVLLKLEGGMQEAAQTKADARGNFSFDIPDAGTHMVRVNHHGVNYFRPAPPGTSAVEVEVFDSATKVKDVTATADLMRVEAQSGTLRVTEVFAVQNSSEPPRSVAGENTFEIILPAEAKIQEGMAVGPGGMPVAAAPVPLGEKGRYGFTFPVRPGETRFQVVYTLPYSGQYKFNVRTSLPLRHAVVITPKSMKFEPAQPSSFQPMQDDGAGNTQVSSGLNPGQTLAFTVSGEGLMPEEGQGGEQADNRPGGGLGRPSETPDPLHEYRWYILGGLAVLLVGGAVYMTRRQPSSVTAPAASAMVAAPPAPAPASRQTQLLDVLKEELFQLEMDRQQNKLTEAEYTQAKAALDQTIRRAISRQQS